MCRYGQEEIEGMLRSRGAKETVEVERKVPTSTDCRTFKFEIDNFHSSKQIITA